MKYQGYRNTSVYSFTQPTDIKTKVPKVKKNADLVLGLEIMELF